MRIVNQGEWEYVKFTYDEELELAKWIMDVLCLPWIETRPGFCKFITRIYWRKCNGRDISGDDFIELLDFEGRYTDELPDLPMFDEGAGAIESPAENRHGKLTKKARTEYVIREKIRAWREVWQDHDKIKKSCEGYELFLGDKVLDPEGAKIAYQEAQEARERAFYAEVIRRQAEWDITRQEAIQAVTDTHPRSEIEELQWDMTK